MKRLLLIAAVGLVACDDFPGEPQPEDQLYFPHALQVTTGGDHLLVLNTNFDQRFSGGRASSLSVDALHEAVSAGTAAAPVFVDAFPAGLLSSSLVIDSFAGQPTYVPGFMGKDRLLVPSRFRDLLTMIDVSGGMLSCDVGMGGNQGFVRVDESTSCPVQRRVTTESPGPVTTAYAPLGTTGTQGVLAVGHLASQQTSNQAFFQRVELFELDTFVRRAETALVTEEDDEIDALPDPRSGRSFVNFAGVTGAVFVPGPALGAELGTFLMVERVRTPNLTLSGFRLRVDSERSQPDVRREIVLSLSSATRAAQSRGLTISADARRLYIALRFQETADSFNSGIAVVDVTGAEPVILSVFEVGEEISKPTIYQRGASRLLLIPDIRTDSVWVLDASTDELILVSEVKGRTPRTFQKADITETKLVRTLSAPADIALTQRGGRNIAFVSNFANSTLTAIDVTAADPRSFAIVGRIGEAVNPDGDKEAP